MKTPDNPKNRGDWSTLPKTETRPYRRMKKIRDIDPRTSDQLMIDCAIAVARGESLQETSKKNHIPIPQLVKWEQNPRSLYALCMCAHRPEATVEDILNYARLMAARHLLAAVAPSSVNSTSGKPTAMSVGAAKHLLQLSSEAITGPSEDVEEPMPDFSSALKALSGGSR